MSSLLIAPPLSPQVAFPDDQRLSDFPSLFDGDWVWRTYCSRLGEPEEIPQRLRLRQLSYNPRRSATATYVAEWPWDEFVTQQQFAIELIRDRPPRFYCYPDDPSLPGLAEAASPLAASRLLSQYVLATSVQRVRLDLVRYRPGGHAVLRHKHGRVRFYVRVMRPGRVPRLMAAAELVGQTGFVLPRLAGCWAEGGVVWLAEIPGKNVRRLIRRGEDVDLNPILDNLEELWRIPPAAGDARPLNLHGAYSRARRVFRQVLRDHAAIRFKLRDATAVLGDFARAWQPSSVAHNDFYDDQMIRVFDGRLALVDFEETGLGDPMIDVGNFLAHMRWTARFGREGESKASGAYYQAFRSAALQRFGWEERDLNLREAVCIFRVCTNPVRHLAPDWPQRLDAGLSLVNEVLS